MGGQLMMLFVAMIVMTAHRSFVDTAALPQTQPDHGLIGSHAIPAAVHDQTKDTEVQELESLKHPAGDGQSVQITNSQSSTIMNENGHHNEQHDLKEYIDENGKLVARVHQHSESSGATGDKPHEHTITELEIPSEGVHRTVVQDSANEGQKEAFHGAARLMQSSSEALPQLPAPLIGQDITDNGNRRAFNADIGQEENNNMDHFTSYSGVQYSPLDMAEYIFWTGDEKGVTLAIEEFLQDGLMTREEAIAFLQEIKFNIDYLQAHYAQQRLKTAAEDRMQQDKQIQELQQQFNKQNYDFNNQRVPQLRKFNHENILKAITTGTYERNNNLALPLNIPQLPTSDWRQDMYKRSLQDNLLQNSYKLSGDTYEKESSPTISEEEYEELLERLRVADFLYTEYSLEEVIYQLAKVMFTQSLARGSSEAQLALQKFTNFLEMEAEQGRISRALEKKVLDVLIESLTDTLTEHPELVNAARVGLGGSSTLPPGNKMLRQLLELGPSDQSATNPGLMSAYRDEITKTQSAQSKFNHQAWLKTKEQSVGEHQTSLLPMQAIKRFKMSV
ncbi:uncharacterized protein LOC143920884 isoform X2 [Arctopsyche grandis]|uniref:uncharacterized protein LOC143920884 isoform X2 n=1 Tax=Arctopsyche grandis TaxID=121162 RepID=UPI00406D8A5F